MFDLYKLGWHSFQQLSLTILREILGQSVESYLDSADGGRDGAFTGTWKISKMEDLSGVFVFQCKHTNRPSYNLNLSDVADEISKARRLAQQKKCDCYILITNAGVSGNVAEDITMQLEKVGVKKVRIFGSSWISSQIQKNKQLRMLVPRVYGLGDLSEILDERAYEQAKVLLRSLREELAKVVLTDPYRRAVEAINEYGFVLLIGEPAAGKTTIASLLSIGALDQWGAFTMKLNRPAEVVKHWNPMDPHQFFWIDDAFGVTQYELTLSYDWNRSALDIKAMLKEGVKIVMTSRDYIYNRARKDLKHSAFPLFRESQVVIDVHDLTLEEKQQILYNHLKLGKQPNEFRKEIKPFLEEISALSQFVPEVARRLSDPAFTKNLILRSYYLKRFVEHPEEFLVEVIEGLDDDSRAALALIYMRNDNLESPLKLSAAENMAVERLGSNLGGCTTALESMRDSLVYLVQTENSLFWKFKHPTIGDAYSSILKKSPELLEIYILGTSVEDLTASVTCGNMRIQKAVVVPKGYYSLVLEKLEGLRSSSRYKTDFLSSWDAKRLLYIFLAVRCSKEFLELYLAKHPELFDKIAKPGLSLEYSDEVRLLIKLFDLKVLPEKYRSQFVQTVTAYAEQGEDFYVFENQQIKKIFTAKEFQKLRRKVREKFIPRLGDWRLDKEINYSSGESPSEYMEPYIDDLRMLKKAFPQIKFSMKVDREIANMEQWVNEKEEDDHNTILPRNKFEPVKRNKTYKESRSIFDDIDM
ncbi:MAG TPA: restriction endonuclease [Hanamia sp.]|nr:restriction endonuclease [Hanamia sp.]